MNLKKAINLDSGITTNYYKISSYSVDDEYITINLIYFITKANMNKFVELVNKIVNEIDSTEYDKALEYSATHYVFSFKKDTDNIDEEYILNRLIKEEPLFINAKLEK